MHWLFDTTMFVPRSHCGVGWSDLLRLVDQASNLIIAGSYLAIFTLLIFIWYRKRHTFPHSYLVVFFASFILFCGWTHLNNYFVFNWPAYRYVVMIDVITAILSVITAITLILALNQLFLLPSFKRLQEMNEQTQIKMLQVQLSEAAYREKAERLVNQVKELESDLKTNFWVKDNKSKIEKLRRVVETLRDT